MFIAYSTLGAFYKEMHFLLVFGGSIGASLTALLKEAPTEP